MLLWTQKNGLCYNDNATIETINVTMDNGLCN